MIFSHAFAGVATTYTIKKFLKFKFSKLEENLLWFIGIVAAIFPDFDLILVVIYPNLHHRYLITHSILTYIALSLLLYLFGFLLRKNAWVKKHLSLKFFEVASAVFLLGSASHIFLDLITGGVVLFAPITFGLFGYPLPVDPKQAFWVLNYIRSYLILFEILLFMIYIYIRNKTNNFVVDYLPVLLFFVSVVSIVFFSK